MDDRTTFAALVDAARDAPDAPVDDPVDVRITSVEPLVVDGRDPNASSTSATAAVLAQGTWARRPLDLRELTDTVI